MPPPPAGTFDETEWVSNGKGGLRRLRPDVRLNLWAGVGAHEGFHSRRSHCDLEHEATRERPDRQRLPRQPKKVKPGSAPGAAYDGNIIPQRSNLLAPPTSGATKFERWVGGAVAAEPDGLCSRRSHCDLEHEATRDRPNRLPRERRRPAMAAALAPLPQATFLPAPGRKFDAEEDDFETKKYNRRSHIDVDEFYQKERPRRAQERKVDKKMNLKDACRAIALGNALNKPDKLFDNDFEKKKHNRRSHLILDDDDDFGDGELTQRAKPPTLRNKAPKTVAPNYKGFLDFGRFMDMRRPIVGTEEVKCERSTDTRERSSRNLTRRRSHLDLDDDGDQTSRPARMLSRAPRKAPPALAAIAHASQKALLFTQKSHKFSPGEMEEQAKESKASMDRERKAQLRARRSHCDLSLHDDHEEESLRARSRPSTSRRRGARAEEGRGSRSGANGSRPPMPAGVQPQPYAPHAPSAPIAPTLPRGKSQAQVPALPLAPTDSVGKKHRGAGREKPPSLFARLFLGKKRRAQPATAPSRPLPPPKPLAPPPPKDRPLSQLKTNLPLEKVCNVDRSVRSLPPPSQRRARPPLERKEGAPPRVSFAQKSVPAQELTGQTGAPVAAADSHDASGRVDLRDPTARRPHGLPAAPAAANPKTRTIQTL